MSTALSEYVEDLGKLLSEQQAQYVNKLANGNFATLEEAKTLSGQIRGLNQARDLSVQLYKNRELADDDKGGLSGMDDDDPPPTPPTPPASRKRQASKRGGK